MSDFDVIRAFGYTVVEVPDLSDYVCLVRTQDVVLVRAGLEPAGRAWAVDWLLARIAATPTSGGTPTPG